MRQAGGRSVGHYAALGVPAGASQRAIEVAFAAWRRRRAAGDADAASWRSAEEAYHVLADPAARARHDRQVGLREHPAWAAARAPAARAGVRQAVALLALGRPGLARVLLERALQSLPGDPAARSYLAVAMARTGGSLHEAARHAEHAVASRPREPAFRFNLAEVYAAAGLGRRAFSARAAGWGAAALAAVAEPARRRM